MEKTRRHPSRRAPAAIQPATFVIARRSAKALQLNTAAPAFGKRKAALYATCFVNYNKPDTGMAARAVLNNIGVETEVVYPGCCGMPFLEQAELEARGRGGRQGLATNCCS